MPTRLISFVFFLLMAVPALAQDLVLTDAANVGELRALVRSLEERGARIRHFFPPDAALGEVPVGLDPETVPVLSGRVEVLRAGAQAKAPGLFPARRARLEGIWRELQAERPVGLGEELTGEAIEARAESSGPAAAPSPKAAVGCSVAGWTSEYLLGDVSVAIVLMESEGAESNEDWSVARQDQVVAEIVASTTALAARYPDAGLDFFYEVVRDVPTEVEPIAHESGFRSRWIGDAMAYLGHSSVSSYIRAVRTRHQSDWTLAAFVVDSLNDADGKFTDGLFAFAYLGGPYMVMTYDNDGWTIGGMDTVFAHEMGHNFRALDEYASAGQPCERRSGVLQVENQNSAAQPCLSSVSCLMRASGISAGYCSWSVGQTGLRDEDADGVPDLRDQPPRSFLDPVDPDPTPSADVTLTGSATALPDAAESPRLSAHTLNSIAGVEFRLDGGPWAPAEPVDGAFDGLCEGFQVELTGLADGWHEVETRAIAHVCDLDDVEVCDPPLTRTEPSWALERFYVNTDCAEDGYEPNDRPGEERAVAAGAIEGLSLCAFDPDRYSVFLRAGASFTARVEYLDLAAGLDLELFSPTGLRLATAAGAGGVAEVTLGAAAASGNHVVVGAGRDDAETAYRLVVIADCIDDPLEPNEDPATAPALGALGAPDLQLCAADADWFRVSVSASSSLEVRLSHTAALGDLDLALFAPDLTLLQSSETPADEEVVAAAGLAAGVHFVRVQGAGAAAENRYALAVVADRCLDDVGENDDTRAEARQGPGRFVGRLCADDEDWTRVDLAEPAFMRAELLFPPSSGTVELEVRDAAGGLLALGAGSGGERRVDLERLLPGTYYLRVRARDPIETDYTLDVAVADPLLLYVTRQADDVLLDWNDAGIDCYWLRRHDRKETFDGGFETVIDVTVPPDGETGHDATGWVDSGRLPVGVLELYKVFPSACAGASLTAIKTVEPYPVVDRPSTGNFIPSIYSITVRNEGRETVSDIVVRDDLPPGLFGFDVLESPAGARNESSESGGEFGSGYVQLSGFALAPGESARVVFALKSENSTPTNVAVRRNRARVTGTAAGGRFLELWADDPATHAAFDSTDVVIPTGQAPLLVTAFWNQDVDIDLRVVDPCGNAIGPADMPWAECPIGLSGGSVRMRGTCGDVWPWGWVESVGWGGLSDPSRGTYQVWLRYSRASDDPSSGCRNWGLEDVVVLVERSRDWFYRWVVLDPAERGWVEAATFDVP